MRQDLSRPPLRPSRWYLGLAALGLVAACTTPYEPPSFAAKGRDSGTMPNADTRFDGIVQWLDRSGGQLDVLVTHGMCSTKDSWGRDAIAQLAEILSAAGTSSVRASTVAGTAIELHRSEIQLPGGTVHATAMRWSPVTEPLKARLCADQSRPSALCERQVPKAEPYPYQRAALNRAVKDGLLNDCFADAVIYGGVAGRQISEQVEKAVEAAMGPDGGGTSPARARNPLVFISSSLGSKVVLDAVDRMQGSPGPKAIAANRFESDIVQIFMSSNQIPLLGLANLDLQGRELPANQAAADPKATTGSQSGKPLPEDPLRSLLQRRQIKLIARPLTVVAFTDPNDLLSYTLAPYAVGSADRVIDVLVSTDTTYAGLIAWPPTVHTRYLHRPAVRSLIACGTSGCPGTTRTAP